MAKSHPAPSRRELLGLAAAGVLVTAAAPLAGTRVAAAGLRMAGYGGAAVANNGQSVVSTVASFVLPSAAAGTVAVASLSTDLDSADVTPPPGWRILLDPARVPGYQSTALFWKRLTGEDAPGAAVFTQPTARRFVGTMIFVTATSAAAAPYAAQRVFTEWSSTLDSPGLPAVAAGANVLPFWNAHRQGTAVCSFATPPPPTLTVPVLCSTAFANAPTFSLAAAAATVPASGAHGGFTATVSPTAQRGVLYTAAVNPQAAVATPVAVFGDSMAQGFGAGVETPQLRWPTQVFGLAGSGVSGQIRQRLGVTNPSVDNHAVAHTTVQVAAAIQGAAPDVRATR